MQLVRALTSLSCALVILAIASSAAAVSQPMAGTWRSQNPSLIFFPQYLDEIGPRFAGPAVVGAGATAAMPNTTVTGLTAAQDPAVIGSPIVVPAGAFGGSGMIARYFPPFANVASLMFQYTETHPAATFVAGGGAAGAGNIQFCPPLANVPAAPTGGSNCTAFTGGTGTGQAVRFFARAGINNAISQFVPPNAGGNPFVPTGWTTPTTTPAPAGSAFGGALAMLRQNTGFIHFLQNPGLTPLIASKQYNTIVSGMWSPGLPNYSFVADPNPPGDLFTVQTGALGQVTAVLGGPNPNLTPMGAAAPLTSGSGWGFKFTTGTIGGSDSYPPVHACGGTVGSTAAANGCFFWSDMGYQSVTAVSGARNIVMVAGALSTNPVSGNLFHRAATLRMVIPEPSTGLGALAGIAALAGLHVARRRS